MNSRKKTWRIGRLLAPAMFAMLSAYSASSQARCSFIQGTGTAATDSEVIGWGNLSVQRDAPVGSVLANAYSWILAYRGGFINCTPRAHLYSSWIGPGLSAVNFNGETLYSVGITGIAMRIGTPGFSGSAGQFGKGPLPRYAVAYCADSIPADTTTYCGASWGPISFQLIKVGPTASGVTVTPYVQAQLHLHSSVYTFYFSQSVITTVACDVTNTAITVPLGKVDVGRFKGVGTTVADTGFPIPLNCNAGTRIQITLDGNGHNSGAPGVLALDGASGARGVGVQVLHNGAPVAYGRPIAVGTAANDGNYNVPLVARYYQTDGVVVPGQANSAATFTMTYN